jgi:hypothetical protein
MAGNDNLWSCGNITRKWPENGALARLNRKGFLAPLRPVQDGAGWSLRPRLHPDRQTIPLQTRALREYAARRRPSPCRFNRWAPELHGGNSGKVTGGCGPPPNRCRAGLAAGPPRATASESGASVGSYAGLPKGHKDSDVVPRFDQLLEIWGKEGSQFLRVTANTALRTRR